MLTFKSSLLVGLASATTLVSLAGNADAATMSGFFATQDPVTIQTILNLVAHPGEELFIGPQLVAVNTPFVQAATLGNDIHGTTGTGGFSGIWTTQNNVFGIAWQLSALVKPGVADNLLVATVTTGFINDTLVGEVFDEGTETIPEPASTLGLLTLGTLGAASTFKRKQKPS